MTNLFEKSGGEVSYCHRPSATTASNNTNMHISHSEPSPLEGLEGVTVQTFISIEDMRKAVNSRSKQLQAGATNQYLVFRPVTTDALVEIDHQRHKIGRHTRMTHYADSDTLIIKLMPSATHESAHINFAEEWTHRARMMGVSRRDFWGLGGTRFKGFSTSKEADSAYKPSTIRGQENDWPTIVFESGLSETLNRLRVDARWWLSNSRGDVKIGVIFSIQKASKTILIEKWELDSVPGTRPSTRAFPNNPNPNAPPPNRPGIPTKIQAITVDSNNATGAPLVLEFQKLFLRPATPLEQDFIFTGQDLLSWAADFWAALN